MGFLPRADNLRRKELVGAGLELLDQRARLGRQAQAPRDGHEIRKSLVVGREEGALGHLLRVLEQTAGHLGRL